MDTADVLTAPAPAFRLGEETAREAPAQTGVYAAWITDAESLAECGVAGPEPRVIYIGQARGSGGLRARLRIHAREPFWSLLDLLASRGTILPGWWHHAIKNQPHRRTLDVPPLAKLSESAALTWQQDHLRWGWTSIKKPSPVESTLIAQYQPLLNLRGRGFGLLGPPQLRMIGDFEVARAGWFFSAAWIAAITSADDGWVAWDDLTTSLDLEIDEAGWPMALGGGGTRVTLQLPTELEAREIVNKACDVAFNDYDNEASAWWCAYAGLAFRPKAQQIDEALRHAFRRHVAALDLPPTLPPRDRRVELLELIKLLPSVAH
jgi:hypothetical protein